MRLKVYNSIYARMHIGITTIFNGSAFGGPLPQVAFYMAKAFKKAGHDVEFIVPADSDEWFIDCLSLKDEFKALKLIPGTRIERFDLIVEVVWYLPPDVRRELSNKTVMFYHYPPVFYDIENSVYPVSALIRSFSNVDAVWTWDHHDKSDLSYLKLLVRAPVFSCPFVWDSSLVEAYITETSVPAYKGSSSPTIVICESNESNSSHCTIPLTILSEIYRKDNSVKWCVLNAESISTREYFKNNILHNLHIPESDISGNYMKRIRLPDLCREPHLIISHQRFRPIKYMMVDALWLGLPLVHNCSMLREITGGEFWYDLNRIGQAIEQYSKLRELNSEQNTAATRRELIGRFGIDNFNRNLEKLLSDTIAAAPIVTVKPAAIRLAFLDMWVDFNPSHNIFYHALKQKGYDVVIDQQDPNLIIFGPFGSQNLDSRWRDVPKIFYTGENIGKQVRSDIKLNIGFNYEDSATDYLRIPNWMLELNWYSEDSGLYKNPVPFDLTEIAVKTVGSRAKFCCFVASNPNCVERNSLFHMINRYKTVDSAGILYNNTPRINGGPGGSGGQKAKVEFYKEYKFALVVENSGSPGYVTEKLLHAKMAGCVPIYWGDSVVEKEFNQRAFIDVRKFSSLDSLLTHIKSLDNDIDKWSEIANQSLFAGDKIPKCKELLANMADKIASYAVEQKIAISSEVGSYSSLPKQASEPRLSTVSLPSTSLPDVSGGPTMIHLRFDQYPIYKAEYIDANEKNVILTTCNRRYVDSAVRLIKSSPVPVYIYTWDVSADDVTKLESAGAAKVIPFDTAWNPNWPEFWNPSYFAWKPLAMLLANSSFPKGSNVLMVDADFEVIGNLSDVWKTINEKGVYLLRQKGSSLGRWSHPEFCRILKVSDAENQADMFSSATVGFRVDSQHRAFIIQCFSAGCSKYLMEGEQFKNYSSECAGHRHDQSVISLFAIRSGFSGDNYEEKVDVVSQQRARASGALFYCHSGAPKEFRPIVDGIDACYVVNLAHRADRLEKFWTEQPFLKGICQREDAVYGNELTLTKEIAELFRDNDFKWKKGVMGCALSHYNIWKKLRAAGPAVKNCLVLEDDAVLDKQFMLKWQQMAADIPADTDMIFIGGVLPPNRPGLPHVTEPVNKSFARVKKHSLFGGPPRRYFHFCTYSYLITRSGVEKMCRLIESRGIFTSIDHMMVNHGDELLNIYFSLPLLASCFQDSDPAYVNADFNNFNRVDKFDSEIWNNVECFNPEEIATVRAGGQARRAPTVVPPTVVTAVTNDTVRIIYFEKHQPGEALEKEWLEELLQKQLVWIEAGSAVPDGSIVLVYYQHTTPINMIEGWVNRHMNCKNILYHASDETCKSDISIYNHPGIKAVVRNYWRPDAIGPKVFHLPLGYTNGKRRNAEEIIPVSKRTTTWSFAGAIDRPGRRGLIDLMKLDVSNNILHLTPTFGSDNNLKNEEYVSVLKASKFIPCLNGFHNVESYRFYEALEAGSLPLIPIDKHESYKNILNGSVNPPLLGIGDWKTAGQIMNTLSTRPDVLDKVQSDMAAWWIGYKKYLGVRLRDIIN